VRARSAERFVDVAAVAPMRPDGAYELPPGLIIDGWDLRAGDLFVWSVGEDDDGRRFAALDARYYGAEGFRCVWLR